MKKLLLILVLCGVVSGLPIGTAYTMRIIYDNTKFYSQTDNFLHQVNLSDSIARIDNIIDSAKNVVVFNHSTGLIDSSYVSYIKTNKISIYWKAPIHTSGSDTFTICFGKSISNPNYRQIFTSTGYSNIWTMDTNTTSTVVRDWASNQYMTVFGGATIDTGYFGNTSVFNGTSGKLYTGTEVIGTGDVTIDAIIKIQGAGGSNAGRILDNGKFYIYVTTVGSTYVLASSNGGTTTANMGTIPLNQWVHLAVTRNASTGQMYMRVNGVLGAINQPGAGTPATGTTVLNLGNNNAQTGTIEGKIDQIGIIKSLLDSNTIKNKYRMEIDKTIYTLGPITQQTNTLTLSNVYPVSLQIKGKLKVSFGKIAFLTNGSTTDTLIPTSETDSTVNFNLPRQINSANTLILLSGKESRKYTIKSVTSGNKISWEVK